MSNPSRRSSLSLKIEKPQQKLTRIACIRAGEAGKTVGGLLGIQRYFLAPGDQRGQGYHCTGWAKVEKPLHCESSTGVLQMALHIPVYIGANIGSRGSSVEQSSTYGEVALTTFDGLHSQRAGISRAGCQGSLCTCPGKHGPASTHIASFLGSLAGRDPDHM
ncbi:hypothetical protein NDU88_007580 [Pleurodeles waltl]|uniref:Uncharacterized protein n=1 Tax=Pleurodeles waltl TaxID=8319 RepID=A0AAV7SSX1_PLEWA|nr:hypothetical protein NDU88_007580 [Pleurodeles waltl]